MVTIFEEGKESLRVADYRMEGEWNGISTSPKDDTRH